MRLAFIANNDLAGMEEDARFAADHGFAGLEFNYWAGFKDLTAETVAQMRQLLDRYGVRAASLGLWGWNHTAPDADEQRTQQCQDAADGATHSCPFHGEVAGAYQRVACDVATLRRSVFMTEQPGCSGPRHARPCPCSSGRRRRFSRSRRTL